MSGKEEETEMREECEGHATKEKNASERKRGNAVRDTSDPKPTAGREATSPATDKRGDEGIDRVPCPGLRSGSFSARDDVGGADDPPLPTQVIRVFEYEMDLLRRLDGLDAI